MFATMRRKSRSRQMKDELGQSVDHFVRAATLAAQETSATVGPKFTAAKDRVQPAAVKAKGAASSGWDSALATITPLVTAATDQVRQTGKVSRKQAKKNAKENQKQVRKAAKENTKSARKLEKRANKALNRKKGGKSKLFGYALLGTAVGIGAAYAAKRRQAAQWEEYEPAAPLSTSIPVNGADDAAFEPADQSPNGTTPDTAPQTPPR
nr:hypothetical protein [uncultured Actinoplanes sp.]